MTAQAGATSDQDWTWETLNWATIEGKVRRLQARIVKAVQQGRWNKAKALQHLLTRSASGKLLAVRRVTENDGRKIPGRPNLNSLPGQPYCFAEWRLRRVGVDYHVELEGHFYSVPYRFARSEVEVRLTPRTVEIFLKGERIAAHLRASGNHRHTTVPEHMPSSHRRYADWTVERIRREAASIGRPPPRYAS